MREEIISSLKAKSVNSFDAAGDDGPVAERIPDTAFAIIICQPVPRFVRRCVQTSTFRSSHVRNAR